MINYVNKILYKQNKKKYWNKITVFNYLDDYKTNLDDTKINLDETGINLDVIKTHLDELKQI